MTRPDRGSPLPPALALRLWFLHEAGPLEVGPQLCTRCALPMWPEWAPGSHVYANGSGGCWTTEPLGGVVLRCTPEAR